MRACLLCVTVPGGVCTTPAEPISYRHFHVELHGSEGRFLHASIDEEVQRPRVLRMWSINIYHRFGYRNVWQTHNDTRARTITIHDNRKDSYTKRPMTDAEFDLCEFCPRPPT